MPDREKVTIVCTATLLITELCKHLTESSGDMLCYD